MAKIQIDTDRLEACVTNAALSADVLRHATDSQWERFNAELWRGLADKRVKVSNRGNDE